MSDEGDCDDLPLININSSANDSSSFTMPSAEELASERARELECERQLQELRDRAQCPAPPCHSQAGESSGASEPGGPAASAGPTAAELWAALAPRLPPGVRGVPAARLPRLARELAGAAPAAPGPDVLAACALLSVLRLAPPPRACPGAARTLHALLDEHAAPAQVSDLVDMLLASFPCPRTRLQLTDVLRSGGGAGADRAATALAAAALLELLAPSEAAGGEVDEELLARAAEAWRPPDDGARRLALRLAGRVLAARGAGPGGAGQGGAGPGGPRARLLAHLAPPPGAGGDAHRLDRLKVLVDATKLRLLFCTEQ